MTKRLAGVVLVALTALFGFISCNQTKNSAFTADSTVYSASVSGATYRVAFLADGSANESVTYSDSDGESTGLLSGTFTISEEDGTLTFTLVSAVQNDEDVTSDFGDDLSGVYQVEKDGSNLKLTVVSGMSFLDPNGDGTVYSAE